MDLFGGTTKESILQPVPFYLAGELPTYYCSGAPAIGIGGGCIGRYIIEFGMGTDFHGQDVTNATLEGLRIYKVTVNVTNKKGNTSEVTYTGYKLADVLTACGVTDYTSVKAIASDGRTSEFTAEQAASEYALLAIEKDKEVGEDGTVWVAPCLETSASAYCKLVVEIVTV